MYILDSVVERNSAAVRKAARAAVTCYIRLTYLAEGVGRERGGGRGGRVKVDIGIALQDESTAKELICCLVFVSRNFGRCGYPPQTSSVGGVSVRSKSVAPSRKGCQVNGQVTKASNK